MRLIDADELIENKFKNDISYNAFVNLVKRRPAADAVPVVRCKDCKCWDKEDRYCIDFMTNEEDGFCKWGKRREDEE